MQQNPNVLTDFVSVAVLVTFVSGTQVLFQRYVGPVLFLQTWPVCRILLTPEKSLDVQDNPTSGKQCKMAYDWITSVQSKWKFWSFEELSFHKVWRALSGVWEVNPAFHWHFRKHVLWQPGNLPVDGTSYCTASYNWNDKNLPAVWWFDMKKQAAGWIAQICAHIELPLVNFSLKDKRLRGISSFFDLLLGFFPVWNEKIRHFLRTNPWGMCQGIFPRCRILVSQRSLMRLISCFESEREWETDR